MLQMEDNNKKNEIVKITTDMEYYPTALSKEEVSIERYMKFPLSNIVSLGTAFEPLTAIFQNFASGGATSGLYMVTIPKHIPGGHLATFQKEAANLGTVLNHNNQIAGQARLNPLVCNPAMLFMAAALMNIDKKLDSIQETQKEIIDFLEQKEKSKLRGNLNFLTDVLNNYKHNCTNEKYKSSNHIKVLDIKQESEQSILFHREQICKKIRKQSFLHIDKDVKDKLGTIQSEFEEYQLALYLYSFASFLETMLLENFGSAFLDGIVKKIENYSLLYRELYTECYNQIEGYSKSSVQSHLLKGLATVNKAAGHAASKIPFVNKSRLEETFTETSNKLGEVDSIKTEQIMKRLIGNQNSSVGLFVENIETLNRLYNQPMELIFDKENIYLSSPAM